MFVITSAMLPRWMQCRNAITSIPYQGGDHYRAERIRLAGWSTRSQRFDVSGSALAANADECRSRIPGALGQCLCIRNGARTGGRSPRLRRAAGPAGPVPCTGRSERRQRRLAVKRRTADKTRCA